MSDATHLRAKVASLSRSRGSDDSELIQAKQDLLALKLEQHVKRVVQSAPPLTATQANKIAALLLGGDAA